MASTSPVAPRSVSAIPWYIWCAALAVTSALVGAHWDISWHSSIGRDTFWTPAHMAIYLCGILAGVSFGFLILTTTFSDSASLRSSSVHIWGFAGPLGAFIASWGGIAMLSSAPFDDWWHAAYGLDVKIVSPPHIVLFLGTYAVLFGTLVLIAGHANRQSATAQRHTRLLFLYVAGVGLAMLMIVVEEFTTRPLLHSSAPYVAMSLLVPLLFAMVSRATGFRWAATLAASIYTAVLIAAILILPLFHAEPKLGPVYQHVTHFVPPQFPILLLAPALALDLLWDRIRHWATWKTALASAVVFLFVLLAVQWPFAHFLMSPASQNRFFGTAYMYYAVPPQSYLAKNLFYTAESAWAFGGHLLLALAFGSASFALGISRGNWLRNIKR